MTRVAAGHPGSGPTSAPRTHGHRRRARCAADATSPPCATAWPTQDRDALLASLQRASAARRNLPARAVRPEHLAELRIPVPDRAGVLAEITSLAADAGIGIYDIEIAHSAEGPRGVLILVVDRRRRRHPGRRRGGPRLPVPGRAAVMTAPRALVVDGGVPCRGTVRTPGEKSISHRAVPPRRAGRGDVGRPRALRRRRRGRLAGRGRGHGRRRRTPRRRDGRPARGRARLHRPDAPLDCGNSGTSMRLLAGLVAGFDWETELVGDESLSGRPMDRVAEPLGLMGATVEGRGERCLPPLLVRGGALHGIDWTSKVASAQVKSAILLAGLSADGTTVVREAVTTRTHTEEMLAEAGADITVEPWGEGRIVRVRASSLVPVERTVPGDPSASAFFVGRRVRRARQRRRRRRRLQRTGSARLCLRAAADGGGHHPAPGGPRHDDHPGRVGPAARHRHPRQPRSPRSTRSRPSPWPPPSPRARPSSPTSASCASRRSTGSSRWPTWSRPSGPSATIDGDTLAITGVGGPLRGARFDSRGDHRMAMAAAVAALAARRDERSLITGFDAVETSYPSFAEDLDGSSSARPAPRPLLVAIDGPAGAGKSTVSTAVAERAGRRAARHRRHVPGRRRPRPRAGDARPTTRTPWPPWPRRRPSRWGSG